LIQNYFAGTGDAMICISSSLDNDCYKSNVVKSS